jgi:hypothetical protein
MKANVSMRLCALVASAILGVASVPAIAADELPPKLKESIALSDGSTVYVFTDGKMAMADKFGRAVPRNVGTTFEAKDGRRVTLTSNESARLDQLQSAGHRN